MYNTFGKKLVESTLSGSTARSRRNCCIVHARSMYMALVFRVQYMPEGVLIYCVLVMVENHLVNVIIDSKGNILK